MSVSAFSKNNTASKLIQCFVTVTIQRNLPVTNSWRGLVCCPLKEDNITTTLNLLQCFEDAVH